MQDTGIKEHLSLTWNTTVAQMSEVLFQAANIRQNVEEIWNNICIVDDLFIIKNFEPITYFVRIASAFTVR